MRKFTQREGVLYVGKAQEKARVMRTERRCSRFTGGTYPWIVKSTAMVNHYYFYCVDEDFGPFFLKFCSYFPYNAKLCINGNEYLKRQLAKRGVAFEALDNNTLALPLPWSSAAKRLVHDLIGPRRIGVAAEHRLILVRHGEHRQQILEGSASMTVRTRSVTFSSAGSGEP